MKNKFEIDDIVNVNFGEHGKLLNGKIFQIGFRKTEICYCISFSENKKDRLFFISEEHIEKI